MDLAGVEAPSSGCRFSHRGCVGSSCSCCGEGCISKIAVGVVAEESVARKQIGRDAISIRAEVARNDRTENLVIRSGWVEKRDTRAHQVGTAGSDGSG